MTLSNFNQLSNCIYINLDERVDRRTLFEEQFSNLQVLSNNSLKLVRFPAIKRDDDGLIGCALSHIECLKIAIQNNWDNVIIFEDDAMVNFPKILISQINSFLHKYNNNNWDVMLLSGNNYRPFKVEGPQCVRVANCQTATCYLVRREYYSKLLHNFEKGVNLLISNPDNKSTYAIDQYWKQLQRADKWYLIVPICITQRPGYSDIEKKHVDYTDDIKKVDKIYN